MRRSQQQQRFRPQSAFSPSEKADRFWSAPMSSNTWSFQRLWGGYVRSSEVRAVGTGRFVDAQTADNVQEGSAHRAVGKRTAGLGDEESLRKTVIAQAFARGRIAA